MNKKLEKTFESEIPISFKGFIYGLGISFVGLCFLILASLMDDFGDALLWAWGFLFFIFSAIPFYFFGFVAAYRNMGERRKLGLISNSIGILVNLMILIFFPDAVTIFFDSKVILISTFTIYFNG